jgi:hypothetical protein
MPNRHRQRTGEWGHHPLQKQTQEATDEYQEAEDCQPSVVDLESAGISLVCVETAPSVVMIHADSAPFGAKATNVGAHRPADSD